MHILAGIQSLHWFFTLTNNPKRTFFSQTVEKHWQIELNAYIYLQDKVKNNCRLKTGQSIVFSAFVKAVLK